MFVVYTTNSKPADADSTVGSPYCLALLYSSSINSGLVSFTLFLIMKKQQQQQQLCLWFVLVSIVRFYPADHSTRHTAPIKALLACASNCPFHHSCFARLSFHGWIWRDRTQRAAERRPFLHVSCVSPSMRIRTQLRCCFLDRGILEILKILAFFLFYCSRCVQRMHIYFVKYTVCAIGINTRI